MLVDYNVNFIDQHGEFLESLPQTFLVMAAESLSKGFQMDNFLEFDVT